MPPVATDSVTRRFALACGMLGQLDWPPPEAGFRAAAVQEPGSLAGGGAQQLTIFYGGRVVVLDGCTPAMAAELIRYAAGAAQVAPEPALVNIPIARKASLLRFLAKRKERALAAARAHHGWPGESPAKKRCAEATSAAAEPSPWLTLGSLTDKHAPRSTHHHTSDLGALR